MAIPSEGDVPLRHVAVDGAIGVGKTSLVEMLARRFHGTKVLEDVDNPFLPDFYKKKKGAAFQTQLFFLLVALPAAEEIAQIDLFTTLVVADYHFPKDKIFACLNLDDSELLIYDRLYTLLSESVREAGPRDLPAGVDRDLHEADQEEESARSRRPSRRNTWRS